MVFFIKYKHACIHIFPLFVNGRSMRCNDSKLVNEIFQFQQTIRMTLPFRK